MLAIRGLRKAYGDTEVLTGIDLELANESFVCLLGLSGAGKTTLLRCANRLVPPTSGDVFVAGQLVDASNVRAVRRRIGFVFQHFNLVNRITALKNVLTGLSAGISAFRSILGL